MRDHRLRVTPLQSISRLTIWAYGRWLVWRHCQVDVTGLEHLPKSGPVLLAVRHYHHLYDAAALLSVLPRALHFLVAFDWARTPRARWLLEWACHQTMWPGLLRADRVPPAPGVAPSVWRADDVEAYARRSVVESVALLAAGRALVVCPEGSPAIDPERPTRPADSMAPFKPGFVMIARQAARQVGSPIPIAPVGLAYQQVGQRWKIQVRIGAPILVDRQADRAAVTAIVEEAVRRLSGL